MRAKKTILRKDGQTNRDWLREIVEGNPFNFSRMLTTNELYSSLIDDIEEYTKNHLPSDREWKLKTKVYWYLNSIVDFPICENHSHGEHRIVDDVINVKVGYNRFCSIQCSQKCESTIEHRKETNMKLHGVTCSLASKEAKEKAIETNRRKWGVDNASQSKEIQEKIRQTNRRKWGVDYVFQSEEVKEKIRQTNEERYGDASPTKSDKIRQKIIETNRLKWGVDYTFQAEEVKEKIRKTNKDRHGVECVLSRGKIRDEIEAMNKMRHGVRNMAKKIAYDMMMKSEFDVPAFSASEFDDRTDPTCLLEFRCLKCGNTFKAIHSNGCHHRCPTCYPSGKSYEEVEMRDFITSIYAGDVFVGDRRAISPFELDIYVPDRKLAVELDGLFWHSNEDRDRNYHLTKTKMCESNGIHLVHVFENEWVNKRPIVESRIKNLLGVYDRTIYARNCRVGAVETCDAMAFLSDNHIQGAVNSKVNLGLYHGDELVSLATFSRPRFSRKYEWELVRFCNRCGCHVPGAASRLLRHFEIAQRPKSIVSYADRRWTMDNGNTVYDRLGFTRMSSSAPNYWYWKGKVGNLVLESRIKYQKHKLEKILQNFDASKSEVQNMIDNGYHRIFDCGNLVYVKEYIG